MTCRGRCDAIDALSETVGTKVHRIRGRHGWYKACSAACMPCAVRFEKYDGVRCPCCSHLLRRYLNKDGTPTGRAMRERNRYKRYNEKKAREAAGAGTA